MITALGYIETVLSLICMLGCIIISSYIFYSQTFLVSKLKKLQIVLFLVTLFFGLSFGVHFFHMMLGYPSSELFRTIEEGLIILGFISFLITSLMALKCREEFAFETGSLEVKK